MNKQGKRMAWFSPRPHQSQTFSAREIFAFPGRASSVGIIKGYKGFCSYIFCSLWQMLIRNSCSRSPEALGRLEEKPQMPCPRSQHCFSLVEGSCMHMLARAGYWRAKSHARHADPQARAPSTTPADRILQFWGVFRKSCFPLGRRGALSDPRVTGSSDLTSEGLDKPRSSAREHHGTLT